MTDGRAQILVVDDDRVSRTMLAYALEREGYAIVTAEDGLQALALVHSQRIDLVLLDVVMPGMDGYAVCRRLRDDPATDSLPVILITASEVQAKVKGLESGADDFISKPFDAAELSARVRSLLRIKRYLDTIVQQSAELAAWNQTLGDRVQDRTREVEEARAEILQLYQELGKRNQDLHELVRRLLATNESAERAAADPRAGLVGTKVERLTAREYEVLQHLAQGKTNNEIAAGLVVSLATVKSHVEHIIAKLGVTDRTQAAVRAVEAGLLSRPRAS